MEEGPRGSTGHPRRTDTLGSHTTPNSGLHIHARGLARAPEWAAWLLTVSERSGFRLSLRKRKATTGMMQTTVVSTMVSHTVGCASVFWAFPGWGEESGGFRSHEADRRTAS